jgi:hypothetical protein
MATHASLAGPSVRRVFIAGALARSILRRADRVIE